MGDRGEIGNRIIYLFTIDIFCFAEGELGEGFVRV